MRGVSRGGDYLLTLELSGTSLRGDPHRYCSDAYIISVLYEHNVCTVRGAVLSSI